jgi:hypothetical protein
MKTMVPNQEIRFFGKIGFLKPCGAQEIRFFGKIGFLFKYGWYGKLCFPALVRHFNSYK